MPEQTATTKPVDVDLQIDAFEYARQYRALVELSERIQAATKSGPGLYDLVFFDGLQHFQLQKPYSDDLLRVKPLECVDSRTP